MKLQTSFAFNGVFANVLLLFQDAVQDTALHSAIFLFWFYFLSFHHLLPRQKGLNYLHMLRDGKHLPVLWEVASQDNLEQLSPLATRTGTLLLETGSRRPWWRVRGSWEQGPGCCQPATAARNPSKGRPCKSGSPLLKRNWGKQGGERSLQMVWEPALARWWWKRPTRPSSWIMFSPRGFHEKWWISPIKHITAGLGSHRWKQS